MKMKRLICSLGVLSFLFLGFGIQAQTIEKSRTIKESFLVGPDAEIEVANKYGSIHLVPWKKDSVKFEIEIMVKGNKQSKVDKSFDYIEVDFKTSKYYVIAQTLFAGKSSFWSDVSDITSAIFNSSTKTKIDYTIYVPVNATLKIMNKYGNIYTTDHKGAIEIDLSNGDLKAHHFSGRTKIKTEFGDADIKKIDNGNLDISYGEFHLEEGGQLELMSKSSKFYFTDVDQLNIDSKRDKYYVKNASEFTGTAYFSLIELDQLSKRLSISTKYGDIDLKSFSDAVESVNLKSVNTDVTLHFPDKKHYKLDIVVDEKTEVMYSADIKNISSKELSGDEKLIKVNCEIGTVKNMTVPLDLDCRAGTLSLKLQ